MAKTNLKVVAGLALAFCLCFGICGQAWAAEEDVLNNVIEEVDVVNEDLIIKTNVDDETIILEDRSINAVGNNKQVSVNILSDTYANEVSSIDIANAYNRAMESYARDMKFDSNGEPDGTFNYTLVGEDEIYFYEQTANSPLKAE